MTSDEMRRHVIFMTQNRLLERARLMREIERLSARFYPDGSRTVSNIEAANSLFRQASEEVSYSF